MVGCHPEKPTPDSGLSNQARHMINEISLGNLQFMEEQEEAMNRTLWAQGAKGSRAWKNHGRPLGHPSPELGSMERLESMAPL